MYDISDDTRYQFDALNDWLGDVYGAGARFTTLLIYTGFNWAEVEQLKCEHLNDFLQGVLILIDTRAEKPREIHVMMQHYGLADGKPQNFYEMGQSYGVCGERMRQLTNQGLHLYHNVHWQAQFHDGFAAIARRLLEKDSSNQAC